MAKRTMPAAGARPGAGRTKAKTTPAKGKGATTPLLMRKDGTPDQRTKAARAATAKRAARKAARRPAAG